MLRFFCLGLLLLLSMTVQSSATAEPVRLILDTDIGNDIDDTFALAMIHALQNRGEVHLLAVTITKDNQYAAPFVNLVNTFYGRPDIPIGTVRHGKTPEDNAMIQGPAQRRDGEGRYLYPHRLQNGSEAPEAVELLTRILQEQPDSSITIVQIGFSTNLARLLQSPGGNDLVRRKVKLLSVMGGNFVDPKPEYNIYTDPESARILFAQWPTPIIFSGFEIGLAVTFPYSSTTRLIAAADTNPIGEACRLFFKKPENRPGWDPTAVLEANRPHHKYFELSAPGRVTLGPKNTTVFTPDKGGNCRYLIVSPQTAMAIRQVIADLVMEPPKRPFRTSN
jgi:inosine-uridine nucleoside N-ribohydrolase